MQRDNLILKRFTLSCHLLAKIYTLEWYDLTE